MTDPTLREDIAAAYLGLARSHLSAAVQLTEYPQRPRLKEIEGDLLDIEDDFHNWADTLDRTPSPPTPTGATHLSAHIIDPPTQPKEKP